MYFINCFDDNYLENAQATLAENPPRDVTTGQVIYHQQAAHRRFGYFVDKTTVVRAVRENWGDLQEHLYSYCVVEFLPEGSHPFPDEQDRTWFKWDSGNQKWAPCEQPAVFDSFAGFALG